MRQRFDRVITITRFRATSICCIYWLIAVTPVFSFAAGHIGHTSANTSAGLPGDFLIFTDVTTISRFDQEPSHKLNDNEVIPAINFFYTFDYKRFRFLGEWLVSSKSRNLERLQLGLHFGESSLWLGRFHNPIGYWNMQFHHGAFLQTTVSRPGIMTFETAGGALPNHLTGLLFEGIHEFDKAGLYYTLGLGAGPGFTNRLRPLNILEPGGSHRPAASFRLGYQPISYGADEIGISAAYTEIPIDRDTVTQAKQFVASTYATWQFNSIHFLSEAVYVHNRLKSLQGSRAEDDFVNVYGQLEWNFRPEWTVFGRVEGTFGANNDPYLALFPKYVEDRFMGGMRYALNRNMALKVELSQDHLRDTRFGQVMFQWSALFP